MSKIENIIEINKKLIGSIEPAGDASLDDKRLENLKQAIDLVETYIDDIIMVARFKDDYRSSMKMAGKEADGFITRLRERFE